MVKATLNFQNNLPVSSDQLLRILSNLDIKFDLYNHKPLFTVEDTKRMKKNFFLDNHKSGQTKNLYLRFLLEVVKKSLSFIMIFHH